MAVCVVMRDCVRLCDLRTACDSVRECDNVSVTVDPEWPCVTHCEGRAGFSAGTCPQAARGAASQRDCVGREALGAWGGQCAPGFGGLCCWRAGDGDEGEEMGI